MKILHLSYHEKFSGTTIASNQIQNTLLKSKVDSFMLIENKINHYKIIISIDYIF